MIKTIIDKMIPGDTFIFCLEKPVDIKKIKQIIVLYSRHIKKVAWHIQDWPKACEGEIGNF